MNALLSVIVPAYQSKDYLDACIESILKQKYENLEIIIVDDGSTDGTSEICEKYANCYDNVKTIHIDNSGTFQARKSGVHIASGEVITFVDSDDWIDENAYKELMDIYEKDRPDIVSFSYQIGSDGKLSETYYEEGLYNSEDIEKSIINGMMYDCKIGGRKINPSVCCKLIKKIIYEEVTSQIEVRVNWGEDALVTYPAIAVAQSLYIVNKAFYHYRVNLSSETHKFNPNNLVELINFYNSMGLAFEKINIENKMSFQLENYMRSFIDMMSVNCWGIHSCGSMYRFPIELVERNSKVQIYGAGVVGKSYVSELLHNEYAELVGWYDKNYIKCGEYAGILIQNPEKIADKNCDIVIAVEDENVVNQIKNYLCSKDINIENIKWKKPIKSL